MEISTKPRFVDPSIAPHTAGRLGVIDIGSSMVRLVVYDDGVYPHLYLNHKVWTLLAKDKGDGVFNLKDDAMARTLDAIEWFLWVCEGAGVSKVISTATSAVREAENGQEFVDAIREKTKLHVEVITGEQEARLSAFGATVSLPNAKGVVVDLGGGSLDICETRTGGAFCSLPLGVLSLRCLSGDSPKKASEILASNLTEIDWFKGGEHQDLVALGAGMRSIASLFIKHTNYPMNILHDFSVDSAEVVAFCDNILVGTALELADSITQEFKDVLPYRAAVLRSLLQVGDFKKVRFASFGLREGLLFSEKARVGLGEDPLLTFAEDMATRDGHGRDVAYAIASWINAFTPEIEPRILQAATLFAHVAWREQYTYRAFATFELVYGAPYVACSHKERALISLVSYFSHTDDLAESVRVRVSGIVDDAEMKMCHRVGVLISIATMLDPGHKGDLDGFKLVRNAQGDISLSASDAFKNMQSESITKRIDVLRELMK